MTGVFCPNICAVFPEDIFSTVFLIFARRLPPGFPAAHAAATEALGTEPYLPGTDSFEAMTNTLHGVHTHTTFIILDRHYSWPSTTVPTVIDMMVLRPPCCTPPSPTALTSPVCLHTPYSRHSFWSGCKQIASSWCFAILFVCACVLLACVSSSYFFG